MTLRLDPKNHKKLWRKGQKFCEWCGYPVGCSIHGKCHQKPHWHDSKAYWEWMFSRVRPTGDRSRARVLNEDEAFRYFMYLKDIEEREERENWRREKEQEIIYD